MVDGGSDPRAQLRKLPRVDRVLAAVALAPWAESRGVGLLTRDVRHALERLRESILGGQQLDPHHLSPDGVAESLAESLARDAQPLPRILNGSGVILNSGLGRAPLACTALEALTRAGTYSLLEVEREAGERKARDSRAAELLCELTGAESALVVNNNAAATMLILMALARGKEVVCARGEMVEIGGSFRIPEVMETSGCVLRDVGATNKVRLSDYAGAIGEETAALMVVHTSNYRIVGFTGSPPLSEIAALAHEHGLPAIHDVGSGSILTPAELGFGDEPPVRSSLEAGMDVVCMSGDKLFGGPQAGIILGKREWIERMRRHPLARALRVDKMTLAALEATLPLFFDPERLAREHPVTRMLRLKPEDLRPRAEHLVSELRTALPELPVAVIDLTSETGSGALPTLQIPSVGIAIGPPPKPDPLAKALRQARPGVWSRILDGRVCLDLRTIDRGEDAWLLDTLIGVLESL